MSGSVLQRIGHYSLAKAVMMVAGLVSYPILTRVLSPEEYGVMGLVLTLLNLTIGVSKLGVQFSTLRMYSLHDEDPADHQRFVFSFFVSTVLISLSVVLLYDLSNLLLRPWVDPEITFFILLSSPLILIRSLLSFGMALLLAGQRSRVYALFEVAVSYSAMICAVLGAAVVVGGLRGYYSGLVLGEGVMVLALMVFLLRGTRLSRDNLDFPLMREAIRFGFPMAIFEMSGVLFYTGDRFIILWLLDRARLGYYTVAFNLSTYINTIFTLPITMTVTPSVTRIYEKQDPDAASRFLASASRWFLLLSFAAVAGLLMVSTDLLTLLASDKYLPGAQLVPVLAAGLLCAGGREILGAGMFLKKRPWLMARLNLMGVALNAVLNVAMIPSMGILGASVATLVSQLAITLLFWHRGSRLLPVPVPLGPMALHLACALLMGLLLYFIDPGPGLVRLLLRLASGAAVYAGLLLAVDPEARVVAGKVWRRLVKRP